jgi:hypothetical protein
MEITQNH